MQYDISQFDVIFISYDEPNADSLYADLVNKIPWAKRIHGVKGFDNAHRACCDISDTDLFVTVDGDNLVHDEFLTASIDIDAAMLTHAWSWSGKNNINELVYGNGGLKLWSKSFVLNMRSHENASDSAAAVDFCWNNNYHDAPGCYSTTITNTTPYQAFRSGYREGVKMSLNRGLRVENHEFVNSIYHSNLEKLSIWCSIGRDVENGEWAIYGARLGAYNCNLTNWDYTKINDYDWFNTLWETEQTTDIDTKSVELGSKLSKSLGIQLADLNAQQSKFVKSFYQSTNRTR